MNLTTVKIDQTQHKRLKALNKKANKKNKFGAQRETLQATLAYVIDTGVSTLDKEFS